MQSNCDNKKESEGGANQSIEEDKEEKQIESIHNYHPAMQGFASIENSASYDGDEELEDQSNTPQVGFKRTHSQAVEQFEEIEHAPLKRPKPNDLGSSSNMGQKKQELTSAAVAQQELMSLHAPFRPVLDLATQNELRNLNNKQQHSTTMIKLTENPNRLEDQMRQQSMTQHTQQSKSALNTKVMRPENDVKATEKKELSSQGQITYLIDTSNNKTPNTDRVTTCALQQGEPDQSSGLQAQLMQHYAPKFPHDALLVRHYKQIRIQNILDVLEDEEKQSSRPATLLSQMKQILSDFQAENMLQLLVQHKMDDTQKNTLAHKAILGFKPQTDAAAGEEEQPKQIPVLFQGFKDLGLLDDMKSLLQSMNQMGQTPLHYAVKNGLDDTAEFLIKTCRVNVNASNKMGNTPLNVAVLNNRKAIVHMLLEAKVDVLHENKETYTCLIQAQKMEFEEMCDFLDPIMVHAEIWQQKNCLVKLMLYRKQTKFAPLAVGVFRQIIKYA